MLTSEQTQAGVAVFITPTHYWAALHCFSLETPWSSLNTLLKDALRNMFVTEYSGTLSAYFLNYLNYEVLLLLSLDKIIL